MSASHKNLLLESEQGQAKLVENIKIVGVNACRPKSSMLRCVITLVLFNICMLSVFFSVFIYMDFPNYKDSLLITDGLCVLGGVLAIVAVAYAVDHV